MKKVQFSNIRTVAPIDWKKPQWVICGDLVVLISGEHGGECFSGTALPCTNYPDGAYSKSWSKDSFKRLNFDITFTISND